jgi:hypothetical protein
LREGEDIMEAWILVAVFLTTLIAFHYASRSKAKIDKTLVLAALCPVVIWLLSTGRLAEFTGLGFGLKLKEVSQRKIALDKDGAKVDAKDVTSVEQLALLPEEKKMEGVGWASVIIDSLTSDKVAECVGGKCIIRDGLILLSTDRTLRGVVFGSVSVEKDRDPRVHGMSSFKDVVTIRIAWSKDDRSTALQMMIESGQRKIPVVDSANQFVGYVDKEKLLETIVLGLVG